MWIAITFIIAFYLGFKFFKYYFVYCIKNFNKKEQSEAIESLRGIVAKYDAKQKKDSKSNFQDKLKALMDKAQKQH